MALNRSLKFSSSALNPSLVIFPLRKKMEFLSSASSVAVASADNMAPRISPFLAPGSLATSDTLSIIHLKRDLSMPTILRDKDIDDEGYDEGKVVNTRFGSFPHNTLIGVPWGSQVRASKVDTGSRGRRDQPKKRKRDETDIEETASREDTPSKERTKEAVTATSGFIHLLPPTPENWTSSLPHRTQVVYTPDYSYVLDRLRARPGTTLIEAGAGSGSFTHASTRAVYNGYPQSQGASKKRKLGKVYSYEFHEQRHEKLVKELQDHGLDSLVQITHRDVCNNGFLVGDDMDQSPGAEAIFLDLPAPWLALPHLSRQRPTLLEDTSAQEKPWISPLNPKQTARLCTFSPCIEQVQRTISTMRQLGWVDIKMVEIAHKRIDVRRERVGIDKGHERGVLASPATVEEALARLKEVEGRFREFHGSDLGGDIEMANGETAKGPVAQKAKSKDKSDSNPNSKAAILESLVERKVYKEGRLVHRSEQELKTHTSYLVFAILPVEWSPEDEAKASNKWPVQEKADAAAELPVVGMSRRQMKKAARAAHEKKAAAEPVNTELASGNGVSESAA
jgi:tRNA (adenine57-N1/adenine58-N1)-methyltransferase